MSTDGIVIAGLVAFGLVWLIIKCKAANEMIDRAPKPEYRSYDPTARSLNESDSDAGTQVEPGLTETVTNRVVNGPPSATVLNHPADGLGVLDHLLVRDVPEDGRTAVVQGPHDASLAKCDHPKDMRVMRGWNEVCLRCGLGRAVA